MTTVVRNPRLNPADDTAQAAKRRRSSSESSQSESNHHSHRDHKRSRKHSSRPTRGRSSRSRRDSSRDDSPRRRQAPRHPKDEKTTSEVKWLRNFVASNAFPNGANSGAQMQPPMYGGAPMHTMPPQQPPPWHHQHHQPPPWQRYTGYPMSHG